MKKFIIALSLLLVFTFSMPFTACDKSGKWTEIQSITYTTQKETTTLASLLIWDTTHQSISEEEWNNAPQDLKRTINPYYYSSHKVSISKNRKEHIEYSTSLINKTYYDKEPSFTEGYYYYTTFYKSFEIKYIKIKFNADNSFELNYNDTNTKVLPIAYEITYFNN